MDKEIVLNTYASCRQADNLRIYDISRKFDGKTFNFYYDKVHSYVWNYLNDDISGKEYRELDDWLRNNDVDVLLDAGSHMGSYGICSAEYVDLVICIEPNYVNNSFLTENIRLNDIDNIIHIPGAVVHNHESYVKFMFHVMNSTSSTVHERMNSVKTKVRAFNFYDIVQTFGVSAVKLDIEGEEIPIVLNASLDFLDLIDFMMIELHEHLLLENYRKKKSKKVAYVDDILEKLRYVFHVTVRGSKSYPMIICKNRRLK